MEYYASFSIIKNNIGFMGVRNETFEAEDLADLKAQINEFLDDNPNWLLDEIEDENGEEIKLEEEN